MIFQYSGILMLFCFATQAQTDFSNEIRPSNPKKTEIHFFGGPSISFLRGNVAVDNNIMNQRKSKYGYAVGLTFNRELNRKFSLTAGLIFEKKGSISNTTATYFDETDQSLKQGIVEYDYEYDYFTLPVQIFYSIGSQKKLSVGVGPFVSYLKKQTLARNFLFVYSTPGRELTDETDMNTKLDFGIVTNILFKIPLNNRSSLSLQLSNTLGLLNIRPNLYKGQVMKTNNISLLIGLITKSKKL